MKENRVRYFEGLRAIMAFFVVATHFLCVYYPIVRYPGYAAGYESPWRIFAKTPLFILLNADVALGFFFATTGYMVGRSVFRKAPGSIGPETVYRKLVARYLKFLPVVAIACIFTHLTMVLGLQHHLLITNTLVNRRLLEQYCNFKPTLRTLLLNIFVRPFLKSCDYVGPLWTIRYEMWNYVLAFLAALVLQKVPMRRLWYVVTAYFMARYLAPYYAIGMLGVLLADLQYNEEKTLLGKYYERVLEKRWFHIVCLIISVYFCAVPNYPESVYYAFWYKIPALSDEILRGIGMTLFLFALANLVTLQKILSWKPLVSAGSISLEVYAIHWPLMMSLEAGLFRVFETRMSYNIATFLAFLLTLPVIYGLAYLLSRGIKKGNDFLSKRKETKAVQGA
ncbi:MAG: acyltransferase [Oscillospiraceae bacterium]|nr:acyltransferase [Oscillospiraceae bacterium]